MVFDSLFMYVAKPDHNKVVSNHLHSFETLNELMHSSLEHLGGQTDTKRHPLPSVSPERSVEVLDVRKGFWHVELEEELSLLTTFNHFGPIESGSNIFDRWEGVVLTTNGLIEVLWVKADV